MFAPVTQRPYTLTLSPHAFHWLSLESATIGAVTGRIPTLAARGDLDVALRGAMRRQLVDAVLGYVSRQRWYAGKARRVQDASSVDVIAIELLCACQAIDLLAPLTTSEPLARVHRIVRTAAPTLDDDRPLSREIAAIARMIASHELENVVAELVK